MQTRVAHLEKIESLSTYWASRFLTVGSAYNNLNICLKQVFKCENLLYFDRMVKTVVKNSKAATVAAVKVVSRTKRVDGLNTREAILAATFRRVVSDGYARLNVREIAKEAGVNHALINYHFRNKQQLVLEVLDQANRSLLDRQQRMYTEPDKVSIKWQKACDFYDEDIRSGYIKLMMELMAASFSDPALRAGYLPRFLAWRRVVDAAVEDAMVQHKLTLPIPAQAISTMIGCFWIGMEAEMALGISEADGHHRQALSAMMTLLKLLEGNKPGP
jgi:AcrR family transcriptional regulator